MPGSGGISSGRRQQHSWRMQARQPALLCSRRRLGVALWARFSRDRRLRPLRRWRALTPAEIGPAGLPTARYPSDHVALCVVFELL